jgi:hypothetical protein
LRRKNPDWGWQAESSWLATPYLQKPELSPLTVVHLVRHPKKVIESKLRLMFFTHPRYGPHFNWMVQFIPKINDFERPEEKAVYWYLKLNEMVTARADIFHRVEDKIETLLDELSIQWCDKPVFNDTQYNTRLGYGPVKFNIETIAPKLKDRLLALTEKYGYDKSDYYNDR